MYKTHKKPIQNINKEKVLSKKKSDEYYYIYELYLYH